MKRQKGAAEYPTSLTDRQWVLIRHEVPKIAETRTTHRDRNHVLTQVSG